MLLPLLMNLGMLKVLGGSGRPAPVITEHRKVRTRENATQRLFSELEQTIGSLLDERGADHVLPSTVGRAITRLTRQDVDVQQEDLSHSIERVNQVIRDASHDATLEQRAYSAARQFDALIAHYQEALAAQDEEDAIMLIV